MIIQEVAIVYSFDTGAGLRDITADFGNIDNGVHTGVDSVRKFGARDPEGRAWTGIDLGDVGAGTRYVHLLLEVSGDATCYSNLSISATVVPRPASFRLFGSGLPGLIGTGRRKQQ